MPYLTVFLTSFVVSLLLTPLSGKLSLRWRIVAEPGGRRQHVGQVPRLGGMPVAIAFAIGTIVTYLLLPPDSADDARRLGGVLLGGLVVLVGGFVDDWRDLSPRSQLLVQFLGAVVAMSSAVFIELFTNPFGSDWLWKLGPMQNLFTVEGALVWVWRPLALFFTLLWVISIINTVNMLDGLDGLAVGVGSIAALLFAWHSLRLGQSTVSLFPLALAGALLGFLRFNFSPARIFLGSAGAYFLGYNLATLSILSPAKLSTALLVMAVPILDVAWRIIDRLRHGQHIFRGDRGHLHFQLSDGGLPTRVIVIGYYFVAMAFGLVAIFATGITKLIMLSILGLLVFLLLGRLSARTN